MNDIDIVAIPAARVVPELSFLFDLKGSREEKRGPRYQAVSYIKPARHSFSTRHSTSSAKSRPRKNSLEP